MSARSLAVLSLLIVTSLSGCRARPELPQLYPVPAAKLVDEHGKSVTLDAMKGSVAVYDFIFTNCIGTCPIMTNNMREVAAKVAKGAPVRFVSISVDPTRDTPEVLAAYAKRVRSDDRWIFLTGSREEIVKLSVQGFKLAAGDPAPGGEPLLHSTKFAVADRQGVIRAYFDAVDGAVPEEVAEAVETLLREE